MEMEEDIAHSFIYIGKNRTIRTEKANNYLITLSSGLLS